MEAIFRVFRVFGHFPDLGILGCFWGGGVFSGFLTLFAHFGTFCTFLVTLAHRHGKSQTDRPIPCCDPDISHTEMPGKKIIGNPGVDTGFEIKKVWKEGW